MGQERVSQVLRSQRRLENRIRTLNAPPPPETDKAAYLQWLFVMAKRDHIAARQRQRAREWAEAHKTALKGGG